MSGLDRHSRGALVATATLLLWITTTVARVGSVATLQRDLAAEPAFEAVSIRVNTNRLIPMAMQWRPDGGVTITNTLAIYLLQLAYPGSRGDVIGLPKWATSTRFDVSATVVPGRPHPNAAQRQSMVLKMLVDRFNFKSHFETRTVPTYDLVLDRKGALGRGLSRSDKDCAALEAARRDAIERARSEGRTAPSVNATESCNLRITGNRHEGDLSIDGLASLLRNFVGRVVINKTGLPGSYRFVLEAVPDEGGPSSVTNGTSVFTAVREQLGLRLVASRGPARFWVIDRLDPPSAN